MPNVYILLMFTSSTREDGEECTDLPKKPKLVTGISTLPFSEALGLLTKRVAFKIVFFFQKNLNVSFSMYNFPGWERYKFSFFVAVSPPPPWNLSYENENVPGSNQTPVGLWLPGKTLIRLCSELVCGYTETSPALKSVTLFPPTHSPVKLLNEFELYIQRSYWLRPLP